MADGICVSSGLERPRYFDRQVIYAQDLTLEQTHRDLQARRLNRYLHGWGVVAGFAVSARDKDPMALTVEPGYALTPLGDEVYLPAPVEIEDAFELARAAGCDCGQPGCDNPDPAGDKLGEDAAGEAVTVYLIARPLVVEAAARPKLPEACGDPGNRMAPSRACGQVCIGIACHIDPPHAPEEIDCKRIRELLCRPIGGQSTPPLPDPLEESANYVVLAAIALLDGRILDVSYLPRRTLLPVETLQNWLGCLCEERDGVSPDLAPVPRVPVPTDRAPKPPSSEAPISKRPTRVAAVPNTLGPKARALGGAGAKSLGDADPATAVRVETVSGIGPSRAALLKEAGIIQASGLAGLTPAKTAKILRTSERSAERIVENARLVSGAATKTPPGE